jgi:RNA polymerase sigma factor (sigma-70 family)
MWHRRFFMPGSDVETAVDDAGLLERYVESRDEGAFGELVARHVDLVFAAARRQAHGDAHLAEDITQAVFVVLAQKARRICSAAALPAWLITTTRFVARDALRAEVRRAKRETEAARNMRSDVTNPTHFAEDPADRERIAPLLDDALARLREGDRILVTLRFLKGMSIAEVAAATGVTTVVAQKRIARAVGKMRDSFARRGIVLSGAATCSALAQSIEHAPTDLATRAGSAALAAHAAVAGTSLLAWKIASSFSMKFAAAVTGVVLLMTTASVVLMAKTSSDHHPAASTNAANQRIKVGVLLSEFTAEGWHNQFDAWDLSHQRTILSLNSQKLELFVLFEPGPQKIMAAQARRFVAPDHFLNAADKDVLRKLDVIVVGHTWHMRPEVLDSIQSVVRDDGVGLLEQAGFAMFTPSFTPQVCAMSGLREDSEVEYFFCTNPPPARVVGEHPILKGLKIDDPVQVTAECGAFGKVNGTPLIAAFGAADEPEPGRMEFLARTLKRPTTSPVSADSFEDGGVFCPLYVSALGKGRIVSCQWHNKPPTALDPTGDGSFYVRCIEWLARRPVE